MRISALLLLICTLMTVDFRAQSTTATPGSKRVTITRTHTDEAGKSVTEAWIAEGEDPDALLKVIGAEAGAIHKIEIDQTNRWGEKEQIFYFRRAGEAAGSGPEQQESDDAAIMAFMAARERASDGNEFHTPRMHHRAPGRWDNYNCAALGVRTTYHTGDLGAQLTFIIEKSGAAAAGLQRGDMIRKIDEFDITDFGTLRFALSHYRPGDEVNVAFTRGDSYLSRKVKLTSWSELPGYETFSRNDCAEPIPQAQSATDAIPATETDAPQTHGLELSDARMYPNPTAGPVEVSFMTEPGPLSVVVTDANGKIVFEERSENGSGRYDGRFDLSGFAPGNYLLTVRQGDRVFTQQIVKQ